MTEDERNLWSYFIDKKRKDDVIYCKQCQNCQYDCKQSFRVTNVKCAKYKAAV